MSDEVAAKWQARDTSVHLVALAAALAVACAVCLCGCGGWLPWSDGTDNDGRIEADYYDAIAAPRAFAQPDPVSVHIATTLTDTGGPVADGTRNAVRDAFDRWDRSLSWLRFSYVATVDAAQISVFFAVMSHGVTIARTEVTPSSDARFIDSSSILLICNPAPHDIGLTTVQEVGHALGIDGQSPNPLDVMYGRPNLVHTPTARDLATLTRVYQECGVIPATSDPG